MANYDSALTGAQIDSAVAGVKNATTGYTGSGASQTLDDFQVDNLKLNGNTITSEDTNGNITLTPNGTGYTILNGQVGLGTSSPAQKLIVQDGNIAADGPGYIGIDDGQTNSVPRMGLVRKSGFEPKLGIGSATTFTVAVSSGTSIDDGGTFTDLFYVKPSGNVGIGTASPDANTKLDVVGVIRASGGIQPNGNAYSTSEVLDDYEEGTWTPAIVGSTTAGTYTPTTVQGAYTKVGRQVTAHLYFNSFSASTGGAGHLKITGLPFAYALGTQANTHVNTSNLNTTNASPLGLTVAAVSSGTDTGLMILENLDNAVSAFTQIGAVGSTTAIRSTITYYTA